MECIYYTIFLQVLQLYMNWCIPNLAIIVIIQVAYWIQFSLQNGGTPLFIASQNGHSDVVNILIRNGANINMAKKVKHYNIDMYEMLCVMHVLFL